MSEGKKKTTQNKHENNVICTKSVSNKGRKEKILLSKFRIVLLACAVHWAEFGEDSHNGIHGIGSGAALWVCKNYGRV